MNNKLLLVVGLVVGMLAINYFRNNKSDASEGGGNIIIDTIADRVIQKLQKDYCPSPYGPGMDPDQIDVNAIKSRPTFVQQSDWDTSWNR